MHLHSSPEGYVLIMLWLSWTNTNHVFLYNQKALQFLVHPMERDVQLISTATIAKKLLFSAANLCFLIRCLTILERILLEIISIANNPTFNSLKIGTCFISETLRSCS